MNEGQNNISQIKQIINEALENNSKRIVAFNQSIEISEFNAPSLSGSIIEE